MGQLLLVVAFKCALELVSRKFAVSVRIHQLKDLCYFFCLFFGKELTHDKGHAPLPKLVTGGVGFKIFNDVMSLFRLWCLL